MDPSAASVCTVATATPVAVPTDHSREAADVSTDIVTFTTTTAITVPAFHDEEIGSRVNYDNRVFRYSHFAPSLHPTTCITSGHPDLPRQRRRASCRLVNAIVRSISSIGSQPIDSANSGPR